jgi:hypothetical protein
LTYRYSFSPPPGMRFFETWRRSRRSASDCIPRLRLAGKSVRNEAG